MLVATLLLVVVARGFAHPAYVETALHFGVALLGIRSGKIAEPCGRVDQAATSGTELRSWTAAG